MNRKKIVIFGVFIAIMFAVFSKSAVKDFLHLVFFDYKVYKKLNYEYINFQYISVFVLLYLFIITYIRRDEVFNEKYINIVLYRKNKKTFILDIVKETLLEMGKIFIMLEFLAFYLNDKLLALYLFRLFLLMIFNNLLYQLHHFCSKKHFFNTYIDLIVVLIFIWDILSNNHLITYCGNSYLEIEMIIIITLINICYLIYIFYKINRKGEF